MNIVLVAAIGQERQLGMDNELLWHLPGDLPRFKTLTMGSPIVMGRKTFDSIGRPLPGRTNIVLSRNQNLEISGVSIVNSVDHAIQVGKQAQAKSLFVIGGGEIYQLFLPYADILELTLVEDSPPADAYFPEYLVDVGHQFVEANRQSNNAEGLIYHYVRYEKVEESD